VVVIATQVDRHRTDRQRQAVVPMGGRHAITRARVVDTFGTPPAVSLLDCWLETGRTHQIRVHMAHVGHALIGDPTYGGHRRAAARALGAAAALVDAFPRQALHAASLGFDHPVTGARLEFESPLPADIAALLAALQVARPG
jgi:23S rRNA pseudouridine1911/1915/1917 synthase